MEIGIIEKDAAMANGERRPPTDSAPQQVRRRLAGAPEGFGGVPAVGRSLEAGAEMPAGGASAATAEPAYVPEQDAPVVVPAGGGEPAMVEVAIAPSVPLPALHMLERILGEMS